MFTFASEEKYQDGQIIFKEGSSGDWVYMIISGSVEISRIVQGNKFVIETLKEGEVFGELGFLGAMKRTASARAVGDTTLGTIDRDYMDTEFNKLSSDFRAILVSLVLRFKNMIDRTCEFSTRGTTRVPKTLSLAYKDPQAFVKAYTGDISSGGLFIKTKTPLKKGEPFILNLQLPGLSEPLKIKCEAAWGRVQGGESNAPPAGMGVKFVQMNKNDNQRLKMYLQKAIKEFKDSQ